MNDEEVRVAAAEPAETTEKKTEFTDETLVCVECGKEFVFSPSASITMLSATHAEQKPSCPLSLQRTNLYTAAPATKNAWQKDAAARKKNNLTYFRNFRGVA